MEGQSAACYSITSSDSNNIVETLDNVVYDFGAPEHFSFDGHVSGPRRPNEDSDLELKRTFYRVMFKSAISMCLWDFLVVWLCETVNLTVSSSRYANGRIPIEIVLPVTNRI